MVNETENQPMDDEATYVVPDLTDIPEDDEAEPSDADTGHAEPKELDDEE